MSADDWDRPARRRPRWIPRLRVEPAGDVRLVSQRVFILPTKAGLLLAVIVFFIWFTSANFNLQLGYLLAFLSASMALVAMLETHRNLMGLGVRELRCAAVHAGEVAEFDFMVDNPSARPRHSIRLSFILPRRRGADRSSGAALQGVCVDVAASSTTPTSIGLPTRRRGMRLSPRVRISTQFPFGLWEAWAYASPDLPAVVYPVPERDAPPLPAGDADHPSASRGVTAGTDDFAGVRPYRSGDDLRRIAWRLAARGNELYVRTFESTSGEHTLLDYDSLPAQMPLEQRLSRLTSWVLAADASGLRYGLHLPNGSIACDSGPGQRERCLEALALFPSDGGATPPPQRA